MIRRSLIGGDNWRLRPLADNQVSLELRCGSGGAVLDFTRHEGVVLAAALLLNLREEGESIDTMLALVRGSALHLEAKEKKS